MVSDMGSAILNSVLTGRVPGYFVKTFESIETNNKTWKCEVLRLILLNHSLQIILKVLSMAKFENLSGNMDIKELRTMYIL